MQMNNILLSFCLYYEIIIFKDARVEAMTINTELECGRASAVDNCNRRIRFCSKTGAVMCYAIVYKHKYIRCIYLGAT